MRRVESVEIPDFGTVKVRGFSKGRASRSSASGTTDRFGGLPDPEPDNRAERWSRQETGVNRGLPAGLPPCGYELRRNRLRRSGGRLWFR
jgi:hypothetical protein